MVYVVKNNESIVDVCLNSTGDLNSWQAILELNSFNEWNPTLLNGQILEVPGIINNLNYNQLQLYPINNFVNFDTTKIDNLLSILGSVVVTSHQAYIPQASKQIYIVSQGETIIDVVLNSTGSLDNWETILNANGFIEWNPSLEVGQEIIIEYLDQNINALRQFQLYKICNNTSINNLDKQISDLISNFAQGVLFDNDLSLAEYDDDLTLALFN